MLAFIDPTNNQPDQFGHATNYYEYDITEDQVSKFVPTHFIAVPQRPSHNHNYINGKWIEESAKALAELRQKKVGELKVWFENQTKKTVKYKYVEFDGGFDSVSKLVTLVTAAELAAAQSVEVFDAINRAQILSIEEAKGLIALINTSYQKVFAIKQNLSVAIQNADSIQSLNSINIG